VNITELIVRKRDGGALTTDEVHQLIAAYVDGQTPDYQIAALLMAIYFNGLDSGELAAWTSAMLHSGDTLDTSSIGAPKIDKHSTGGVGDKVSIPLVPMVASCGVAVPMISGRGLGHTGGTLDKLESIPGFRVRLDPEEFISLLESHGMVMGGQSDTLVPADRMLYALRDVTGTVPSIPLISSSILSKKLSEDIDGLVLDVKVGRGAFMQNIDDARHLAETMVGIAKAHPTAAVALLTRMDEPLGREVGNANEMAESLRMLRGEETPPDLEEITYRLGEAMLVLGGVASDRNAARSRLEETVSTGKALEAFAAVIEAQGGDPRVTEDLSLLPQPLQTAELVAPTSGWITRCDAHRVGIAGVRLGAGRARKEDDVDHRVGITILAKEGEEVTQGQPLAKVGWADEDRLSAAMDILREAWVISDEPPTPQPLIIEEIR
jgi:pyrimidine-nucleoside phosphorylase